MANQIAELSIEQLKRVLALREQIDALQQELAALSDGEAPGVAPTTQRKGKRVVSAEAKARMAVAQQQRWAKKRGQAGPAPAAAPAKPAQKGKRTMSPEAKAKISAAQKARHAQARAERGE